MLIFCVKSTRKDMRLLRCSLIVGLGYRERLGTNDVTFLGTTSSNCPLGKQDFTKKFAES